MPDLGTPNTGGVTTGTRNVGSLAGATPNTGGKAAATVNTGSKAAATVLAGTVANEPNTGALEASTTNSGGINALGPKLNVVLLLFDDGGAEKFNWSGLLPPDSGYALTPRLDEMRARGVTFLRAYANCICHPSRAAVESGRYAFRTGAGGNPEVGADFRFGFDGDGVLVETLLPRAVRLGNNGTDEMALGMLNFTYAMAAFGKWHLCSDDGYETHAVDIGFGRYTGCQPNAQSIDTPSDVNSGHFHFNEVSYSSGGALVEVNFGDSTAWTATGQPYFVAWDSTLSPPAAWDAYKAYRDTITWINSRTQPFVVKVCFNPPHSPFEIPPYTAPDTVGHLPPGGTFNLLSAGTQAAMTALDGGAPKGPGYKATLAASKAAVHKANTEAVDSLIGMLWDRMDPEKRDSTVFIWVGDNGTVADAAGSPYDPDHSKRTVYEQGVRVPMIVWGPPTSITLPGRTCDHLVHITDVFPTIMSLTQSSELLWNPLNFPVDGISFERVLRDTAATSARSYIYTEVYLPLTATIANGQIDLTTWKRTYSDGTHKVFRKPDGASPLWEMYKITSENQPASSQPGYLELAADNLYAEVLAGTNPTLTAKFNSLSSAMAALQAS